MPLCQLLTKVYDCGFAMVVIAIHVMDMLTIPYLLVDDEKGEMDVTTMTTNKISIMRLSKLTIDNSNNNNNDEDEDKEEEEEEEDPI